MRFSSQTLEALEFPTLLELVAYGTVTDVGRQRVLDLAPVNNPSVLRESVERGQEAERLLEDGPLVPSLEQPFLAVCEKLGRDPHGLDGLDLLTVRDLLSATRPAARRILDAEPACPALAGLAARLPDLSELERRLRSVLDHQGRVRDDASPRLAELRRRGQKVRQRLYGQLERYVRSHHDEIADDTVTLQEERLVVLLRSGAKRPPGLVHGRSGSRQSIYFEPLEVVDDNNELREVHAEEAAERRRLLRELIREVTADAAALEEHLSFVAELDLRQAAVRWADAAAAAWCLPSDDPSYHLVEGRHPLLDPLLEPIREAALGHRGHKGEVVPLTVELAADRSVLVITGPNAGGKTVALKTLGLLALAAHCGLPVPASPESRIPNLTGIVATVGDEQDLLTDQSTFSGRLLRLKEAWNSADSSTLILLDELGSGTDPEEGAALGVALLEGLLEARALAAVSSHLTRVAAAALDLDGAACAAMTFDPETGSPTYRLAPGTPGSSEAMALARRLELPTAWIERAEELLGPEHGRLQSLLAEVEEARDELARRHGEVAAQETRLATELERLETQRAELEEASKRAAREARRSVGEFRREVRDKLRSEVARLEKAFADGRRRGLVAAAEERLFRGTPVSEPEPSGLPVLVGGLVKHRTLGWEGRLGSLDRGRAEVVVAGKRVRCSAADLDPIEDDRSFPPPKVGTVGDSRPVPPDEIHLRGERVEAAIDRLEHYLDQALLAELREVRIVHGHGSGRLRTAVRELLDRHPAISDWRPGTRREGGDGATVAVLTD